MSQIETPLILSFVRPVLEKKLSRSLADSEFVVESVGDITALIGEGGATFQNDPGEPVHGRDGRIFNAIVQRQPLLILFETANERTAWRRWVEILKSSAATRRTPIIVLADDETLPELDSRRFAADLVVRADQVEENLAAWIAQLDRRPDRAALRDACREPLAALAIEGIELFNAGEYFDAHEELEHAWNADQGPARDLYRGILQVGVAYLQIERGNYRGAVKMLLRVKQWLDPLPPVCRTVEVDKLRREASAVYEALLAAGPDGIEDFDRTLFKPVVYQSAQPS